MGAEDDKEEINSDDPHEWEKDDDIDIEEGPEDKEAGSDSMASPQPHPDDLNSSSDEEDDSTESPEETAQNSSGI